MASITSSSGGGSYVSGLISGIDTATLIKTAVNARLKSAVRLDDQISAATTRISAYSELQRYATATRDALAALKEGGSFGAKQVTAKSSSAAAAENILSASVGSDAKSGTHRVVVEQLAQEMRVSGAAQTSKILALGLSGSFTLARAGTTGTTIRVTPDMTLADIASAISAAAGDSGVEADIVQSGAGYALVLSGAETAQSFTAEHAEGDDILNLLGVTDGDGGFVTLAQAPQQAIIRFDGSTLASDTNRFADILGGLSLTLENAAPDTTITLTVGNDSAGITEAVQAFIDSYNNLRGYLAQNQKVESGAVSAYAYLFGEALPRSMSQTLAQHVTAAYGGGDYNSLGALGITLNSSNALELDKEHFTDILENHYAGVESFFAGSSGFAETLSVMLENYAGEDGLIDSRVAQLQAENDNRTLRADAIREKADAYEQQLITRYAEMESRILTASILKRQITALLESGNGND